MAGTPLDKNNFLNHMNGIKKKTFKTPVAIYAEIITTPMQYSLTTHHAQFGPNFDTLVIIERATSSIVLSVDLNTATPVNVSGGDFIIGATFNETDPCNLHFMIDNLNNDTLVLNDDVCIVITDTRYPGLHVSATYHIGKNGNAIVLKYDAASNEVIITSKKGAPLMGFCTPHTDVADLAHVPSH